MIAAKTKYFKIKNPETGEFDSFIFIKGDKGWMIGPDQITNELGNSKELVPSQYLINSIANVVDNLNENSLNREIFDRLEEKVNVDHDRQISELYDLIMEIEERLAALEGK